ncbi:HD domain-containing protein [Azospirillum formosense]|uniref:HD domain-containing protein n=1 Tax=Azospirillum formosense TaxID=861533 RepID=A0ABX2KPP3_9PROT|nr:hypothetical protein [Azospirillum formosense]NUB18608.1 HD domain-containing protein [Azospirillum formosense]
MQSTNWHRKTLELAKALHAGQVDKAAPYWLHLGRVAQRLVKRFPDATKAQVQAALLHDAIENAGVTPDQLRELAIEGKVIVSACAAARTSKTCPISSANGLLAPERPLFCFCYHTIS